MAAYPESSKPLREHGKLYQDQLYRAKTLSPLAAAILDTAEVQRLAGLKQLGFSDVVYRGARHTRLEHSVGTYLICKQMMRRIVQNHERFGLPHPGSFVSPRYAVFPQNSGLDGTITTFQARWRGLMEVVGATALLHDIGHVPFGHTLEDEFVGIFDRHDRLAGHRVHQLLFNESSELAQVFSAREPWLQRLTNEQLRQMIYLSLSWTEKISPPQHFRTLLAKQLQALRSRGQKGNSELHRVEQLESWYSQYSSGEEPLYQPFMSDIVGNTICADLLDYLPRDRNNLGLEYINHERVQRYFTIRPGTLHKAEGYRMAIMVTRVGHGGQRRDVASAVLQIMRERFEMAEAVYYHHKKASASAMLAKLAEIFDDVDADGAQPKVKPRDDEAVYPAPWNDQTPATRTAPHMLHLSDSELIDYLGDPRNVHFKDPSRERKARALQRQLYLGLRYRRKLLYRTLLVIDTDLVNRSKYVVSSFVTMWRGEDGAPTGHGRRKIENALATAASAENGEVLLYCPGAKMQSKEIHARLEIEENRIVPLSTHDSFVYAQDVKTLTESYATLWRSYLFVAPHIFKEPSRCRAIIERFCEEYDIDWNDARAKVRGHTFAPTQPPISAQLMLDDAAMFDTDELLKLIAPIIGANPSPRSGVHQRFSRLTQRGNKASASDRVRIRRDLDNWSRSPMPSPDALTRAEPRMVTKQVEEIFNAVLGLDGETKSE